MYCSLVMITNIDWSSYVLVWKLQPFRLRIDSEINIWCYLQVSFEFWVDRTTRSELKDRNLTYADRNSIAIPGCAELVGGATRCRPLASFSSSGVTERSIHVITGRDFGNIVGPRHEIQLKCHRAKISIWLRVGNQIACGGISGIFLVRH